MIHYTHIRHICSFSIYSQKTHNTIDKNGRTDKTIVELFPIHKKMRRSEMVKSQLPPTETKKSSLFRTNQNYYKDSNLRDSIRMRDSYMTGRRKYESSGSKFVNQMSQRVNKLLGRNMHKKSFRSRYETTSY